MILEQIQENSRRLRAAGFQTEPGAPDAPRERAAEIYGLICERCELEDRHVSILASAWRWWNDMREVTGDMLDEEDS